MNLTDIQIKAWIKNNERFEGKADTGTNIRGLYISYRKDFSTPQWRFRYKIQGKSQQFFFGQYPEITLKVARKKAEEFRAQVRLGINPAEEKRKTKAKSVAEINKRKNRVTVAQFADKYYENRVKGQLKEPKHALGHINRIKDNLGNMSIEEVSSRHITDMYTKDLKRGYPSSTNKMHEQTKRMFKHAVVCGVIQISPAESHDISYAGGGQESRERNLSKGELISLFSEMRAAKGFGRENYLTIKLLLLLCVRKSELIKAKKAEFDLNDSSWLLVKESSKNTGGNGSNL